ncbi:unnamed protein product [Polarella glacialis]|uniref:DNA2/NAM7 helicase-like C-terminal domain-containing protein n=1 Tax=Polarella glacialis TaxID=89957 RepID=A0A813EGD0_POLGL|nr:unnamed protein product [Polarella glacialis]
MAEVSTIDRYQGDENDIVIVSLVRSNSDGKLGFLGSDDGKNRMCVAQSRARRGLYFLGNAACLRTATHWRTLLDLLEERGGCLGSHFPQRCPRHLDVHNDAQEAEDLCTTQSAVCKRACEQRFGCGQEGHTCGRPCHPEDEEDGHEADSHAASKCPYTITKAFSCLESPKHMFPGIRCSRDTSAEPCPYQEDNLQCSRNSSHKLVRKCGQSVESVVKNCKLACDTVLSCDHRCPRPCSETCVERAACEELADFECPRFPQRHRRFRCPCNSSPSQVAESCKVRCSQRLPCGHYCPKLCCEPCVSDGQCQKTCKKVLGCGHTCLLRCSEACQCTELKRVPCKRGGVHTVEGLCFEEDGFIAARCTARCSQELPCGHRCPRPCSAETCIDRAACEELADFECPRFPHHRKLRLPCNSDQSQVDKAVCEELIEFDCPRFPERHRKLRLPCRFSNPFYVAESCKARCLLKLACGHFCAKLCCEPCTRHGECQACAKRLPLPKARPALAKARPPAAPSTSTASSSTGPRDNNNTNNNISNNIIINNNNTVQLRPATGKAAGKGQHQDRGKGGGKGGGSHKRKHDGRKGDFSGRKRHRH